MQVKSILTSNALVVRFEDGTLDKNDELIYNQVKFSKIKLQSTDDKLLTVGNAIAALIPNNSFSVRKEEYYVCSEE